MQTTTSTTANERNDDFLQASAIALRRGSAPGASTPRQHTSYSPVTGHPQTVSTSDKPDKQVSLKIYSKKSGAFPQPEKKSRNSRRTWALIIAISLLSMALISAFTVPGLTALFVAGDPVLTALNVTTAFSSYLRSVVGWMVILVLDLLVSLGIYNYYKKEKPKLARGTALLRLIYSSILGLGIFQLLAVKRDSAALLIYNSIQSFQYIWGLGLIVFGLHLISLGLLYHNEGGKKWVNTLIKSLLIVAGIGYVLLYVGILVVPNPASFAAIVQPIFLLPMILGETLYAIWKLIKGGKKTSEA